MVKTFPFALGWRPMGSKKRRWQLQDCVDAAGAAGIAASLVRLDGGGRWRVYDMVTVPGRAGSLLLVRRNVVAEGVVRPDVPRAGGTGSRQRRSVTRLCLTWRFARGSRIRLSRRHRPAASLGGGVGGSESLRAAWPGRLPPVPSKRSGRTSPEPAVPGWARRRSGRSPIRSSPGA